MTPKEREARIRELPKLIADEKDNEKLKVLAAELARLLGVEHKPRSIIPDKKPQSS
jgi:hypothetical protein